jgi:NUMOD3 motif
MATNPLSPVFYVYQHLKSDTREIFYVGKGMGRRAHDSYHRSKYWKNIVAKHGVTVEFLRVDITEPESLELEIATIEKYRTQGLQIINMTDGGDGTSGYSHTEEHKQMMSAKQSGESNPRFGKVGTRKGAVATPETIEKLRLSHLGKELPEEQKQKIRESTKKARAGIKTLGMTGRVHSEETKAKMREKALGRKQTAESIAKISMTKKLAAKNKGD